MGAKSPAFAKLSVILVVNPHCTSLGYLGVPATGDRKLKHLSRLGICMLINVAPLSFRGKVILFTDNRENYSISCNSVSSLVLFPHSLSMHMSAKVKEIIVNLFLVNLYKSYFLYVEL